MFVTESREKGWQTYVVGLDIQGAFDCASLGQLTETLAENPIPEIVRRFIGSWPVVQSFRIKLGATCGVVYRSPRSPTGGAPKGGALSLLLWILRVKKVNETTRERMEREILLPKMEWGMLIQFLADDISAAVARGERRQVIILAEAKARKMIQVLGELGLEGAPRKCTNFIVSDKEETRKMRNTDPHSNF